MPTRASSFAPSHAPERAQQRRDYDRRRSAVPWRGWYKLAKWARIRDAQFSAHPLCCMCQDEDVVTPANVCDHVTPHRGCEVAFWSGPFQSLCEHHHNSTKQREERGQAAAGDGRV